jgi:hypothetical protein
LFKQIQNSKNFAMSEEESDLDAEFLNAMNGDSCDDTANNEETVDGQTETADDDDDEDDEESRIEERSDALSIVRSRRCNFLALLGDDILIRICSTLSASNLCELAKTCTW